MERYYVYLDSFYGTELIGSAKTLEEAKKIKAEKDMTWEPGFLWDTRITAKEAKETNYYN